MLRVPQEGSHARRGHRHARGPLSPPRWRGCTRKSRPTRKVTTISTPVAGPLRCMAQDCRCSARLSWRLRPIPCRVRNQSRRVDGCGRVRRRRARFPWRRTLVHRSCKHGPLAAFRVPPPSMRGRLSSLPRALERPRSRQPAGARHEQDETPARNRGVLVYSRSAVYPVRSESPNVERWLAARRVVVRRGG